MLRPFPALPRMQLESKSLMVRSMMTGASVAGC